MISLKKLLLSSFLAIFAGLSLQYFSASNFTNTVAHSPPNIRSSLNVVDLVFDIEDTNKVVIAIKDSYAHYFTNNSSTTKVLPRSEGGL